MTGCSFCDKPIVFPDDFRCKFCHQRFCSEHIQLEKHECVKSTPVKYIRKTWLRKYFQNISTGRYIVVCDQCSYFSQISAVIEFANQERKHHIETSGCFEKNVFLEEDLSNEKIPKDIKIEQYVPSDRLFWICCHCKPPKKFMNRNEYIAHHYFHN